MKKERRSTIFLKECIVDALISLMQEKAVDKITADDIATVSGVGRATYFRHFKGKDDVITYHLRNLYAAWINEHPILAEEQFSKEKAISFFAFNESIKPLLLLVYHAGMKSAIRDAFIEEYAIQDQNDAYIFYRGKYYAYGFYGLLESWISRDFKESSEAMAQYLCDIIVP